MSNTILDFTDMFKTSETNENENVNVQQNLLTPKEEEKCLNDVKSSSQLEKYYPNLAPEDIENLPTSVEKLLFDQISQVLNSEIDIFLHFVIFSY